jgi:UDP-N-acetylglucosamine--N-acetylmuramyl-(pentapeptide) pyrophosphoryl-undecaprenol N-acetylglucosamine transferase
MRNGNIIIASSGTGGHIYPGIALAEEFKSKGYNPIFFISNNAASIKILKNSGFEYIEFNVSGMPREISFLFVMFLVKMNFSFFRALRKIVKLNPLAVVGTGGYISIPVLFAAKILYKKIFIHEQNAVPGKANMLLNKISDKTFINFQSSEKYFKKNTVLSDYPIRKNILSVSKEKLLREFKIENWIFTFLVFGGSLGAVKLNEAVCETLLKLSFKNRIRVLHITGFGNYIKIREKVGGNPDYRVFEYMHNIGAAYAASDIVICRSGAGSVFELKALDKPAILVPYPYAADNHQYWNAKEIEKKGKVIIIEEKNLTEENLSNAIYVLKKNIKINTAENIIKFPRKSIFEEIIKCMKS